ncbi:MAG: hypothetical protein AB7O52_07445 [Planctomycetota bacterium]
MPSSTRLRVSSLLLVSFVALGGSSGCATYAARKIMDGIDTHSYPALADVNSVKLARLADGSAQLAIDVELANGESWQSTLVVDRNSGSRSLDDPIEAGNSPWSSSASPVPFVLVLDEKLPALVREGITVHRTESSGAIVPATSRLTKEEFADHAIVVLRVSSDRTRLTGWMHMPPDDRQRTELSFPMLEESRVPYEFALQTPGEPKFFARLGKTTLGVIIYPLAVAFDIATLAFAFV